MTIFENFLHQLLLSRLDENLIRYFRMYLRIDFIFTFLLKNKIKDLTVYKHYVTNIFFSSKKSRHCKSKSINRNKKRVIKIDIKRIICKIRLRKKKKKYLISTFMYRYRSGIWYIRLNTDVLIKRTSVVLAF